MFEVCMYLFYIDYVTNGVSLNVVKVKFF